MYRVNPNNAPLMQHAEQRNPPVIQDQGPVCLIRGLNGTASGAQLFDPLTRANIIDPFISSVAYNAYYLLNKHVSLKLMMLINFVSENDSQLQFISL